MTSGMYRGTPVTALNTLSQITATAATAQYNRWDREREREKEKERKRKERSDFAKHLEAEIRAFPGEAGQYFEARA